MTLRTQRIPEPQGNAAQLPVLRVPSWDAFQSLRLPAEDAVAWDRALPEDVQAWLDGLPETQLPSGRFRLVPSQVGACIAQLFEAQHVAPHPALTWLCDDARRLADWVADLHGASILRLRLEAVFDNACSKFHVDNVLARLICTYCGPGTQLSLDTPEAPAIETVATGVPVLLKGKLWPQANEIALQHRSPPIENTGLSRLVLVLEPLEEDDGFGTSYDQRFDAN